MSGFTMRDWFAGQAMAALLESDSDSGRFNSYDAYAQKYYAMADAMMRQRTAQSIQAAQQVTR